MLPLPHFEGPLPDLTTDLNLQNMSNELLAAAEAAAAAVDAYADIDADAFDTTALDTTTLDTAVLSPTHPASGDILVPPSPSLFSHPPHEQHEHHESSLLQHSIIPETPESNPISEAPRADNGQASGSIPNFETHLNVQNMYDELLAAAEAAAAAVDADADADAFDTTALDTTAVLSPTHPASGDILMPPAPSLFHDFNHPPHEQHDSCCNNVPVTAQHFPTPPAQNSTTLFHTASQEQPNFNLALENLEEWRWDDTIDLEHHEHPEHHESSLLEHSIIPETPERNPISEPSRADNGQASGSIPKFETHLSPGTAHTESKKEKFILCSKRSASQASAQQLAVPLTRTSGSCRVIPSSEKQGCLRNQDTLGATLTNTASLSPLFHVRPNDDKSERPAKRQRRAKATTLANVTPLVTPHVSGSPSQSDPLLNHRFIMSNNQRQLVPITIQDDAVIAQHMKNSEVKYQCKRSTNDSARNQGATFADIDNGIHRGKEVADDRLVQSARSPADDFEITEGKAYIQTTNQQAATFNFDTEGEPYSGEAAIELETPESASKESEAAVAGIDTHSVIMKLENPPECNECEKLYITDKQLKKHIRTAHAKQKPALHKCNECDLTFKSSTNLERHIFESHQTKNVYCPQCRAGFNTKRGLVLHKKAIHKVAPRSFKRKKKTGKNSCASTSEKKVLTYHACLLCDYCSTVKGNMMRHVKGKHLNEKRFECKYCGKPGKTKQNVVFHELACQKKQK